LSFDRPILLLTLVVVPLAIAAYLLAERRRMRYAVTFTNLEVLASVAGGRSARRFVPPALFLVALALLCVALARPQRSTLVASDKATVILVIDVSGSMHATDVKPTRLGAAQAAVLTFLDLVPKRVRVGLIAFSSEPEVAAPPSTDRDLVRQSLDQLDFLQAYGGTAIGDALAAAVALAKPALPGQQQTIANTTQKPGSSLATILFLSDGKQTRGTLEPLEGAQRAKDAGIPVFTIALGTPHGTVTGGFGFGQQRTIPVPPDPTTLSAIARLTGGKFYAAQSAESVSAAYSHLGSLIGRIPGRVEVTNQFLALAALLLIAAWGLATIWSPRLP
jgi:Ca-activated chloride channel family protein